MSFARRTTKAAVWQILARGGERALKLLSSLVLARLLVPEDFGRLTAALVLVGIVETLSALGVEQAIIQSKRGDDPRFLSQALRTTIVRGFGVALVMAALSPVAAWFNEDREILWMTLVIAISPAIAGFTNPWVASRRRALDFRAFAVAAIGGGAIQVATAVLCAWQGLGALSLAIGIVASTAGSVALGWLLAPRQIDFAVDPEARAELRGFMRKAMGTQFILMLCNDTPALLLGRMADLATLGTYSLARRVCSLPTEVALPIFGNVLGPAYASLRTEPERLRQVWLFALMGIPLLAAPAVAGSLVLDERLPSFLFGAEYAGSAGLVSVLGVTALVNSLTGCCGPLFWGLGEPQYDRRQILIRFIGIAVTAVPATRYGGATGLAGSIALAQVAALIYAISHARRLAGASGAEVRKALMPAALAGGILLALFTMTDNGLAWLGAHESVRVIGVGVEVAASMVVLGLFVLRMRRAGGNA